MDRQVIIGWTPLYGWPIPGEPSPNRHRPTKTRPLRRRVRSSQATSFMVGFRIARDVVTRLIGSPFTPADGWNQHRKEHTMCVWDDEEVEAYIARHKHLLTPEQEERLRKFIDTTELDSDLVTRGEWKAFCAATGRTDNTLRQDDPDDAPAVGMNAVEAEAYAEWAGGYLPSEAQLKEAEQALRPLLDAVEWNQWPRKAPEAGIVLEDGPVRDIIGVCYQWTSTKA